MARALGRNGTPTREEFHIAGGDKGVTTPMWRADGKELFYLEDHTLMAVEISTNGAKLVAGPPRRLFKVNIEDQERRNRYLVSKDGQRFLFIVMDEGPR